MHSYLNVIHVFLIYFSVIQTNECLNELVVYFYTIMRERKNIIQIFNVIYLHKIIISIKLHTHCGVQCSSFNLYIFLYCFCLWERCVVDIVSIIICETLYSREVTRYLKQLSAAPDDTTYNGLVCIHAV